AASRRAVPAWAGAPGRPLGRGADEPQANGVTPAALRHAYRTVKRLDPAHRSVLVQAPLGSSADLAPYSQVTDIHGVDVYPVSFQNQHPSLRVVGARTAVMMSATPSHAVSVTLQICSSKSDGP